MSCRCGTNKIQNYIGKISWPLLDRIDIFIETPDIKYKEFTDIIDVYPSEIIKAESEIILVEHDPEGIRYRILGKQE